MSIKTYLESQPAIEQGDGYRLVQLPHHAEPVLVLDHARLVGEVSQALGYAATHGGALPQTEYWGRIVGSYVADPALFVATHQCQTFLTLVIQGVDTFNPYHVPAGPPTYIHERPAPPEQPTPPTFIFPPLVPPPHLVVPPTILQGGGDPGVPVPPPKSPDTPSVPEPATGLILGASLLICLAMRRLRRE